MSGGANMGHVSGALSAAAHPFRYPFDVTNLVLDDIKKTATHGQNLYEISGIVESVGVNATEDQKNAILGKTVYLKVPFDPSKLPIRGTIFFKDDRLKPIELEAVTFENHSNNRISGRLSGLTLKDISLDVDMGKISKKNNGSSIMGRIVYINDHLNNALACMIEGTIIWVDTSISPANIKKTQILPRVYVEFPNILGGTVLAKECGLGRGIEAGKPLDIMEITRMVARSEFNPPKPKPKLEPR